MWRYPLLWALPAFAKPIPRNFLLSELHSVKVSKPAAAFSAASSDFDKVHLSREASEKNPVSKVWDSFTLKQLLTVFIKQTLLTSLLLEHAKIMLVHLFCSSPKPSSVIQHELSFQRIGQHQKSRAGCSPCARRQSATCQLTSDSTENWCRRTLQ